MTTEAAAHAILRLAADFPGQMGRLRVARIIGGHSVAIDDDDLSARLAQYGVDLPWPLRETVALVDALIDGGLLARTLGARPTLVLTRAGHRALDALDGEPPPRR